MAPGRTSCLHWTSIATRLIVNRIFSTTYICPVVQFQENLALKQKENSLYAFLSVVTSAMCTISIVCRLDGHLACVPSSAEFSIPCSFDHREFRSPSFVPHMILSGWAVSQKSCTIKSKIIPVIIQNSAISVIFTVHMLPRQPPPLLLACWFSWNDYKKIMSLMSPEQTKQPARFQRENGVRNGIRSIQAVHINTVLREPGSRVIS